MSRSRTAFVVAYAVGTLHMPGDFILAAVLTAATTVRAPLRSSGRRNTYLVGIALTGLFGFLYFEVLDTTVPWSMFVAIVSLIPQYMQRGPQAVLIAEAFTRDCGTAAHRWGFNWHEGSPAARLR